MLRKRGGVKDGRNRWGQVCPFWFGELVYRFSRGENKGIVPGLIVES